MEVFPVILRLSVKVRLVESEPDISNFNTGKKK